MNLSSVWSAGAYGSRPGGAQGHAAGIMTASLVRLTAGQERLPASELRPVHLISPLQ
jgi:hypothetical protein